MIFVADESLERQVVDRLRQDGHTLHYVAEMDPGISDDVVLDLANQDGAILITADKDFGELVYRLRRLATGIMLVRLAGLSPLRKASMVASAICLHESELDGAFVVVSPGSVRIRRMG